MTPRVHHRLPEAYLHDLEVPPQVSRPPITAVRSLLGIPVAAGLSVALATGGPGLLANVVVAPAGVALVAAAGRYLLHATRSPKETR